MTRRERNQSRKGTKRALTSSILAIVLCVVLLAGATFAWFTDTASTKVSKIEAGTLTIDIGKTEGETWTSYKGGELKWQKATEAGNEEVLWEPGATYSLEDITVKNTGTLALKYKVILSGIMGDEKLNEAIDWTIKVGEDICAADSEFSLAAGATSTLTISGTMKTTAGNEYQGLKIEGITITVTAAQDTVESDSEDNQYDKNATYTEYPAGVTTESFESATSVPYWNGYNVVTTGNAAAVAAYVDSEGKVQYTADLYSAICAGATTIYMKEGADAKASLYSTNRTQSLSNDLTIYANGADFGYGEIAVNGENERATTRSNSYTLKVYDARNIKVWGYAPNNGATVNIVLENCTNEGKERTGNEGILLFLSGTTGTVNVTINNCRVTKNNTGVYMSTNGSVTVTNSVFEDCACAIKASFKAESMREDKIENCTFINCGCTEEQATAAGASESTWLWNDSAAILYKNQSSGTLSLTHSGNTFTGTIGGDDNNVRVGKGTVTVNGSEVTVNE